nr:RecName: Full=Hainantoxin F8-35.23; AltName: Full=Peptide F8-35.23 [Haplopelma hainanum]
TCSIPYEYSNGKLKRTLYYSNGVYANSFTENN